MLRSSSSQSGTYRAAGRPERLLRSSVGAFCANPRPTRREIAQLDDLAVPLLGSVSDECLRFVAAALSDLPHAPPTLIRRLADQPPEISAPILVRSPVLTSIDLVALIGRHGLLHARAIAAREDLDERIARLIRSIGVLEKAAPDKAEETRERLRAMMQAGNVEPPNHIAGETSIRLRWDENPGIYRKLRSTALTGAPALFHTALADAIGIGPARACDMVEAEDLSGLIAALRSLSLTEEQAFLIVQCMRPERFTRSRAVADFLDAFKELSIEQAQDRVARWDDEALRHPANQQMPARKLRAS